LYIFLLFRIQIRFWCVKLR